MPVDTREHASEWMQLGPVIGHTTHDSARILVQPFAAQATGELQLRIAKADVSAPCFGFDAGRGGFGPVGIVGQLRTVSVARSSAFAATHFGLDGDDAYFRTALFELDDLEPDTRYFYEVVPADAPRDVAGAFASRQPLSLRTLPTDAALLKFAFLSCNGLHKPPRGRRPTAMWQRLVNEALGDPAVYFALLGGDQVYADVIREEWLREHDPDFDPDPSKRSGVLALFGESLADSFAASLRKLPDDYERIYRTFWRRPEIRVFMGHMPCMMTWDDHELYDGWGSHGNEQGAAQQAFFKAAAAGFDAFQFQLAPGVGDPTTAAAARGGHRAFSFRVGDVAFIVLDLRSKRNVRSREISAVLGDAQWQWLSNELDKLEQCPPKQLVLVSSIPVVYMGAAVEDLMPSTAEMYDDILDHWSSRPNRNDQARLLGNLFRLRKATGANIVILAGDVHVAAVGDIRSTDPRFLRDGEREAVIYQGVSSAIAYESPAGVSANAMRMLVQREHPVHGGFVGRIDEFVPERNFAVVCCQHNGVFRFTLFHEGSDVPEQHYFGC